jgi:hypothetical protein
MALVAIMLWYMGIGVLAAIGTTTITRSRFSLRVEQVFFAVLLIPVAGMYLAFIEYFGGSSALRPELYAIAVFVVLALLGIRLPAALILGYALHGAWGPGARGVGASRVRVRWCAPAIGHSARVRRVLRRLRLVGGLVRRRKTERVAVGTQR